MARLKAAFALLVPTLSRASALQYQLIQEYDASNIFEEFDFFSGPDPTGGFVQYVSKEVAADTPLIGNSSDLIYIGVDSSNVYTSRDVGRPSVRLESKLTFTEGLFVFDLTHIPVGCGTWPALWTTGLADWPADGEIDIIENVNDARANNAAIHAAGECAVAATTAQTGIWKSTDCNISHDENQGCGTVFTEPFNYGSEFNANGGGVYAMEWTSDNIKIWFFPPTNIPPSLSNGGVPESETFGTPSASFSGPCSTTFSEKFFNHSIVIDTTFCGGWAGGTFGSGTSSCPLKEGLSPQDSCVDFVASNPEAFKDAYWGIRSVKVWEKVPGFTVQGLATPDITQPTPISTIEPLDVIIKSPVWHNVSKPIATIEPLSISPLTGGALSSGDDSEDFLEDDEDSVEDDLEDILDAIDDPIDENPSSDILDTEQPSGIIIAIDIDPVTSEFAILFDQPESTLYGGSLTQTLSSLPSVSAIRSPFGVGNTEAPKELFPPELSLPVPTKGPQFPASNGNTGIVPPHLQHDPPGRQQNPAPSGVIGVQRPNTLPLLLPNPVLDVPTPESNVPTIGSLNLTASKVTVPQSAFPVSVPQLNASASYAPAVDAPSVDVPPVKALPSGDNTGFVPPKHSNPLIPAGIGNTGIVPPSISDSPIVSLWSSFGPELKNKLIVAATYLLPTSPSSSPLNDLWASLSPELKGEVLNAANNLPASTPENSVPTISDLINAASSGKIGNLPELPPLDLPPAVKPAGGLLGFLDAKTKNKLKALFSQAIAVPTGGVDLKRQVPLPSSVAIPVTTDNLQPLPAVVESTKPTTLSQPVAPVFKLTPNVPVTALTTTDTMKAMTGLLSFLDDSTKDQIADLLFPDDSSTADNSPPALGGVTRRSDTSWKVLPTWNDARQYLQADTIFKLDGIIKTVSNLDGEGPDVVTNNIWDVLNVQDVGLLKEEIDSIDINDKLKLAEFFTGDKDTFNDVGSLIALLLLGDGTTQASELQDIMNAANDYARSPNDDTMNVFMEILQDSASSLYEYNLSKADKFPKNNLRHRRQAVSNWTAQDKIALAQNVYALCPAPALAGIPFPSPVDFITDLLDPNKALEDAAAAFQRKLQAYFDVTVQACWAKINQWLAWRELLRKPGTPNIAPFPIFRPATMRIQTRQKEDDGGSEDSNQQDLIEQQIYTICPKPDTFSTDQLIADLEDVNTSIEIAISRFQNKLWAYMAKLQACSDKIREYGPKLKALSAPPSPEPVSQKTDQDEIKRHHARQVYPSLAGVPPTDILDYLVKLQQTGTSYKNLPFDQQKGIYDALLAGTRSGWPGNPRTTEQLQNLVFQLTQAASPQPLGPISGSGDQSDFPPTGNETPDEGSSQHGGSFPVPGSNGGVQLPYDGNDGPSEPSDDNGAPLPGAEDGANLPPPSDNDSGNGGSDISLPVDEGGPDGGFDDGITTPPEAGEGGPQGIAPGEPNPSGAGGPDQNDGSNDIEPGDNDQNPPALADDTNAAPPGGDDATDPYAPGNDPFAGSPMDDDPSTDAFVPADDSQATTPAGDGASDAFVPSDGFQDAPVAGVPINTPSEAPPVEAVPADDTGPASETTPAEDGSQDFADDGTEDITPPSDGVGDENPAFLIDPPGFRSRILRNLHHRKRQEDQNGIIPDTETPADLEVILGPHGTLDPFGFLGPQISSPDTTAPATTPAADPHDQPNIADDQIYDLPDTAVDEASPDVDQALQAGEQDPFGQLQYSKDASDEDAVDSWESKEFLGKLRNHEHSEQSVKYLGDPKDVQDFVDKFLSGNGSGTS